MFESFFLFIVLFDRSLQAPVAIQALIHTNKDLSNKPTKEKKNENDPSHISYVITIINEKLLRKILDSLQAGIGFLNNPRQHGLIRLTTTVSELIERRVIFRDIMKSAASAKGPAHWGL